jgi:formiminotetrahydrofolate cyclodeaminase
MAVTHLSLNEFLARTASREPTPGGGAAAAAVGALGAALASMAAVFSLQSRPAGGKGATASSIESLRDHFERVRHALTERIDRDVEAYGAFHRALGLPRSTVEEKERRRGALRAALERAMEVPLECARLCRDLAGEAGRLAEIANPNLVSDVGCAAVLVRAAFEAARFNVLVNLRGLPRSDAHRSVERELADLGRDVTEGTGRALRFVEEFLRDKE